MNEYNDMTEEELINEINSLHDLKKSYKKKILSLEDKLWFANQVLDEKQKDKKDLEEKKLLLSETIEYFNDF